MRILVTGATGFVGLNIVQQLQEAGHEVVALLRPGAKRHFLAPFQVEERYATFRDEAALQRAMHQVETVIHTAGNTSCNWRDINALSEANVLSTRNILKAARRKGVRRIIYTSTTSTIGSHHPTLRAADVQTPLQGFRAKSPYAMTKLQAENILLEASNQIECIILNPAEVVGAWDHNLQWGRIIIALAAGQLPFIPPGTCTYSPATDVAKAHVNAITQGRNGQRYILGGEHLPIRRFIDIAAQSLEVSVNPRNRHPYFLRCWQAQALNFLGRFLEVQAAIEPYRMRVFGEHHLFDDSLARQELHYHARPIHEAINECIAWYREHDFLKFRVTESRHTHEKVSIQI